MTEVLKAGALGIGLVALVYAAALLRQELAKPSPSRAARNLILTFMAFSLLAFCIAAFIEIREKEMAQSSDAKTLASRVAIIATSLDRNLGDKFQITVKGLPLGSHERDQLIYFTNDLCRDVKKLKAEVGEDSEQTSCSSENK